ncbi:unnamed protein product [Arabis nemorensis]|uniref:Uncharacterized protein n=1 Tax=Arabis nemorensis TaxID=586526 RepID=A0A565C8B3_9BRAS|nr:unnamed protein product [Arabis nemorensis]
MSKKKETKLSKFLKVPIKMVVKARDLYIKSMNQLSSHDLGGAMSFGIPTVCHVSALPRSFSASHSQTSARDKEHRVAELVRAASARNMTIDTRPGVQLKLKKAKNDTGPGLQLKLKKAKSLRSCNDDHHGFERIDETSPLIDDDHKMFQRSKSYGLVKSTHALQ